MGVTFVYCNDCRVGNHNVSRTRRVTMSWIENTPRLLLPKKDRVCPKAQNGNEALKVNLKHTAQIFIPRHNLVEYSESTA